MAQPPSRGYGQGADEGPAGPVRSPEPKPRVPAAAVAVIVALVALVGGCLFMAERVRLLD